MSRHRIIAGLFLTGILTMPQWVTFAQTARPVQGADERDLVKACQSRLTALSRFDVATLDRFTHRDYIGTGNDGARMSKADLLRKYAAHSAEPPNSYGPMQDVQLRLYGAVGVLNYRTEIRERYGNSDIVTALRRTDVFLKEDGRWQEISSQLTNIPISHLTPVAADPAHYDDYIGDYEITAGNVDHVTRDGQTLVGQSARGKAEFLPLGGEKFFFREAAGQVTFQRESDGHVSGYRYQRCDGQDILARKIK